ncbi:nucleotide sugar dehydrogenase [Amylibacter sp.]|nr:nucleotide sugar dehydrogenase [Amylibacter sp.]
MKKIAIIGLGYVGLPLAVAFGKQHSVVGFDIDAARVKDLNQNLDKTNEVSFQEIASIKNLTFSSDVSKIADCNIFIITVPTPIDMNFEPDLSHLKKASSLVGSVLKAGDIVIYESTVYPGATEEVCVPILEQVSKFIYNQDFFVGYSPERINPGDKINTLTKIPKITAGSSAVAAQKVDEIYADIIEAGTHMVSSIRVAEATKVIENIQRDMNIAVINEFAKIFNVLDIDTDEVLKAASTKWNFSYFKPGLVGGHCIGVDPYYLTYKSTELGFRPDLLLSGRRINNGMAEYVAVQLIKLMTKNKLTVANSNVLVLGFTFKGNCPDIRNTKIIDLVHELESFGCSVDVSDPLADTDLCRDEYAVELIGQPSKRFYDAIIIAVDHVYFSDLGEKKIRSFGKKCHVLYDLKNVLPLGGSDLRL